jgi:nicotinate-nucleotide pyrophosphorylase (carboxylating)
MTIQEIIRQALLEDLGDGDHTSLSTIPADATGSARLVMKQDGIIAGLEVAKEVYRQVDAHVQVTLNAKDGDHVTVGDVVLEVSGSSVSILSGERLALNFLQRMSGIATYTNLLVSKLHGLKAEVLDTRKTTPLLRELEKMAVRLGGGSNHRMGLYDMIMIKDNHVDFAGGIAPAIDAVKGYLSEKNLDLKIEIEVRDFEELEQVIDHGGVDRIMLDNFTPGNMKKAVEIINGRYETEASGGITEENIREYGETGVDYISVGALTHQIKSLDMSLKAVNK